MKNFNFVISADNNPALKSMRAVSAELYRINAAFRTTKSKGVSGGGLDPKALNVVQDELKKVNSIFKTMTGSKNQWERDAGFTQLKNAFKGTAEAAGDLKKQVIGILDPVLALTGIGTVAGIGAIAENWRNLARDIKLTNYETDLSTKTIQQWIGMGQAFGIKSEEMTAGIRNFAKNMEDTAFGRNNPLMAFLSRPDINVKDIRTRIQTPEGVDSLLREVSQKLQGFSPIARAQMLDTAQLGFMKPMLMQGPEEFDKRKSMVDSLIHIATPEELARAQEFDRAMGGLNVALNTFEQLMGDKIQTSIKPFIEGFSKMIVDAKNVNVIFDILATTIGVTLAAAVVRLSTVIMMSPFGRIVGMVTLIADAGIYAYEKWKPFHDMMWELISFWDRLHFGNMGSNKSMIENYDSWSKRMGIGQFSPPPISIPTNTSLSGPPVQNLATSGGIPAPPSADQLSKMDMSAVGALSSDSTIIRASDLQPQEHKISVDLNNAPPGTKVTTKSSGNQKIPVNINYSLQSVP